jgi:integrase/recombinase XerD
MSIQSHKTLPELSSEFICHLNRLFYSNSCIEKYEYGISKISKFMKSKGYIYYSSEVCEKFIIFIIGRKTYKTISTHAKGTIRCANALLEYQTTGAISFRTPRKSYDFKGEIGKYIKFYIEHRKSKYALSDSTSSKISLYLSRFHDYLITHNICNLTELEKDVLLNFINSLSYYSKSTIHSILSNLKGFLQFLYDNKYNCINWTYLIPRCPYKTGTKLPTTYSKEEVEKLIRAVDRGNPKGKRDFAIILMAARLGMRASDICGLQFDNIQWEKNTISLMQKKTSKQIELPLLEDVGNSIIVYMKYGRPESNLPYVFIRMLPPFQKLESPTLHSIVSFYLHRAGIKNLEKRKHGPHALRHSLAARLLEKKTPLPVISEVLGHRSIESTNAYLRIDLTLLRQCAVEVPPLNSLFYKKQELEK